MNRRAALLTPIALLAGAVVPPPKRKLEYDFNNLGTVCGAHIYPSLGDTLIHATGPKAAAPVYVSRGIIARPSPADEERIARLIATDGDVEWYA